MIFFFDPTLVAFIAPERTWPPSARMIFLKLNPVILESSFTTEENFRCWISTFAGALGTPGHVASRLLNPYVFGLDYDPWTPTTTFHYARHDEDWSGAVDHIVKVLEEQFSLEQVAE